VWIFFQQIFEALRQPEFIIGRFKQYAAYAVVSCKDFDSLPYLNCFPFKTLPRYLILLVIILLTIAKLVPELQVEPDGIDVRPQDMRKLPVPSQEVKGGFNTCDRNQVGYEGVVKFSAAKEDTRFGRLGLSVDVLIVQ